MASEQLAAVNDAIKNMKSLVEWMTDSGWGHDVEKDNQFYAAVWGLAQLEILRDRVTKLLALHEVWKQLWSVDSPIRWSDLEAAAKAAGVGAQPVEQPDDSDDYNPVPLKPAGSVFVRYVEGGELKPMDYGDDDDAE